MKMPVDYTSTVNPIDCCTTTSAPPAPVPDGSIKYHVDETGLLLRETWELLDRLIEFLWAENDVTPPATVNVRDLNSATISNYIMAQGIHDRAQMICDRIGMVM